ncbi:MAG TPA: twin-arginine translocase subunit TatC [Ilumatobacter sp.]|nr:twin-arginine translocase subunit TatC [Ilumatobacter sp.]
MRLFPARNRPAESPTGEMTLFEHLAELRMRIIRASLAVMLGVIVVIAFYDRVMRWLTRPYIDLCVRRGPEFCGLPADADPRDVSLVILDPIEGFATRLKVSFYGGMVLALPVILWQLWKFIVPALHKNERGYALGFVASTVVLFAGGGAVAYLTLEKALEFLISWSGEDVNPTFQVQAYVRLVTLMVVAFGIGFTIPVLLVFLQLLGVIRPGTLLGAWRYAVVGTVALAAVITPSGDPISLAALAGPMIVLYFAAILIGWLIQRSRRKREADEG